MAQFRAGAVIVWDFDSILDKIELRQPRVELTPDRLARGFSFAQGRALIAAWTKIWRISFARRLTRPRLRGVTIPVRPSMP